jgi:hypothetical protein
VVDVVGTAIVVIGATVEVTVVVVCAIVTVEVVLIGSAIVVPTVIVVVDSIPAVVLAAGLKTAQVQGV